MNHLPRLKVRQRMNVQPPDRVICPGHCKVVRTKYQCLAAGKVSAVTNEPHVCEGRIDPHHARTRGAGGDDTRVVPLCRRLHNRLDSPGHSQASVEKEFGLNMLASGAALWQADTYHRVKFEREWREQWPGVDLPYGTSPIGKVRDADEGVGE